MADPIEFYFEFSSPYGYLAAERIDALAAKHGRRVTWRPFLLGAVFEKTGGEPLLDIPLKGDYVRVDLERAARLMGVNFTLPSPFPFMSVAACRAFYWLADKDGDLAKQLAKAVYRGSFAEGRDMSSARAVVEAASGLGVSGDELAPALKDQAVKERLRAEVDKGISRGVFGSPFIFIDGEPFWGQDRLDHVDRWLETGGW